MTLDDIRRAAVDRSLFTPTTLQGALDVMGFVQADPIRAPARAQDLTLRHRVIGYRAGDLERHYAGLDVHEDIFINYGFVTSAVQKLMHPRGGRAPWNAARGRHVRKLLDFVRARGSVHPREVDKHFAHGTDQLLGRPVSAATTHLLDAMHYRGLLGSMDENGIRITPLTITNPSPGGRRRPPGPSRRARRRRRPPLRACLRPAFSMLVRRLRYAAPQWAGELSTTLQRARHRLPNARVDGTDWYWPAGETISKTEPDQEVRLLAPFDPVVWDRRRFEMLWGWAYRFEAYTPVSKRKLGYYALPLLWQERVIGWGNLSAQDGKVRTKFGYVSRRPKDPCSAVRPEELDRFRA
jgi:uncharacterized protein YcaQ